MSTHYHLLELIERLGNLLRGEERQRGKTQGLQPVHWQALDYLARCNRMSDTPLALSQYLGVSKGTASQSVLVLHNKGLITKTPDSQDGRVVHLRLSAKGRALLGRAGQQAIRDLADTSLTPEQQDAASTALTQLLQGLIARQGGKSFGVCHSCRHFIEHAGAYRCGLIDVPLEAPETEKICHEHRYP